MSKVDELIQELCPDGVKRVALGEVGTFVRGNGLQKSELQTEGFPAIHYGQIHTVYNHAANETKSFVSEEKFEKLKKAAPGDIVLATTSEDDEAVGKAIAWLGDTEVAVSGDAIIYSHSLNPSFVSYFLESPAFQDQKAKHISGTKVRRISSKSLSAILIPLPPLEVQEEIVRILHQFVELDRELEEEIAGREQQFNLALEGLLAGVKSSRTESVDSVFNVSRGRVISKGYLRDNRGDYPVYSSQTQNGGVFGYIDSYDIDEESLTWTTDGAYAGAVFYHAPGERFSITNVCGLLTPKQPQQHSMKFLHSALGAETRKHVSQGMGNPKLMSTAMKRIQIPLPPLEVQDEIAAKLDAFTEYIDNLKRERELRQKQYEYYRNQLLDFKVKE